MFFIMDIDGVLFDSFHRLKFLTSKPPDWDKYYSAEEMRKDRLNDWAAHLIHSMLRNKHQPLFFTGRSEICRDTTMWQLCQMMDGLPPVDEYPVHVYRMLEGSLAMRKRDDKRKSIFVKGDMLHESSVPSFNILFAIDDEPEVCHMWQEDYGIPALYMHSGHWDNPISDIINYKVHKWGP